MQNKIHIILAIFSFALMVIIERFINDSFIRPYMGDVIVAIFIYCLFKIFFSWSARSTAIISLTFCYLVEILQYINIISILNLEKYHLARIIIGTSFSWYDILCYTTGVLIIVSIDLRYSESKQP
ncbi:hypothetical protein BST91_06870 [Nonlabens tegetincola]|uniref:ribosomal maturation YjgA family protein n=1 Tax=Nonlabens tegetincola TaxID=323273 RepID=UPI000A206752|nr:DUF2809 domain-containing protein [Nonlabens tegetincola]ARN71379.1 hypothetical protein BST91_06870 [Nonlabens tegetincola]